MTRHQAVDYILMAWTPEDLASGHGDLARRLVIALETLGILQLDHPEQPRLAKPRPQTGAGFDQTGTNATGTAAGDALTPQQPLAWASQQPNAQDGASAEPEVTQSSSHAALHQTRRLRP